MGGLGEWAKKIKRRKELILPYYSATPTGRLGSLTPGNRMAWGRVGKCEKKLSFYTVLSPPRACGKKNLLSVRAASSEGLHLEQGSACKGSRVTSQARTKPEVYLSPRRPDEPCSVTAQHASFSHSFLSLFVSPSSLVYLFSFLLWREAVIHNPLNYRRLNYPSPFVHFLPLDGDSKTINLFTAGDFSQERAQQ